VLDPTAGKGLEFEDTAQCQTLEKDGETHFDLIFLRYSLVVDGAFITMAAFATRQWHIYLGILIQSQYYSWFQGAQQC
jgi:hypothetical protein